MVFFENLWWLLVLISVMIVIHELGHYWAAVFFNVKVEAFSIGFGPRLFSRRRGETEFKIAAIPFGGYVKMLGEQPGEESTDPRSFLAKPRWQRLIIAFAGPAMNILLAVALLTGLYMVRFPKTAASDQRAAIGHVQPDSPAAQAGIKEGDVIAQFNGKDNPTWEDIMLAELAGAGQTMTGLVERNGQRQPFSVTPKLDEKHGIGVAGWSGQSEIIISGVVAGGEAEKQGLKPGDLFLSINNQPIRTVQRIHDIIKKSEGKTVDIAYEREGKLRSLQLNPRWSEDDKRWLIGVQLAQRVTYVQLGLGEAFVQSVQTNAKGTTLLLRLLQGIVERRMSPKSLEGPIRIAQISGDAAREGAYSFVSLMATVSLNLAVFNLLPIPILDGGIILLLLIEMLMRRDLSMPVKETVFKLGFVFLMMVVVFVLYNDITKIFPG